MTTEHDERFAQGVAALLGEELDSVSKLGDGVLALLFSNGRRLVAKGVARQSLVGWQAGKPWAELVALDALSAVGAPVPRLIAADLEHGWLVMEMAAGDGLEEVAATRPGEAFSLLAQGLMRLEEAFAAEWESLERWAVPGPGDDRRMAESLAPLLEPGCREAWFDLVREATEDDTAPGEGSIYAPGPLDVQAANVVWEKRVTFLDMATYGYDVPEKRLSAYAQRAGPKPVTLLDARAFTAYRAMRGDRAALRLAFYDLLFWGIAAARLLAVIKNPDMPAARLLAESWGEPRRLFPEFERMWARETLDDPRVERVRAGLLPMQEARPG